MSFQVLGTIFPTDSAPELYERHDVVRELLFVYLVSNQFRPGYLYKVDDHVESALSVWWQYNTASPVIREILVDSRQFSSAGRIFFSRFGKMSLNIMLFDY